MSDRSQYIVGILVSLCIAATYLYFTDRRGDSALEAPIEPEVVLKVMPQASNADVSHPATAEPPASDLPSGGPALNQAAAFQEAQTPRSAVVDAVPVIEPRPESIEVQDPEPPSGDL